MGQVITFEGFQPIARYDGLPWTEARIEEATTPTGSWTAIETIALSPVDSDPSAPAVRNLTTENASATTGLWYRIIFVDANDDEAAPTDPISSPTTTTYVSRAELKASLNISSTAQDAEIDESCESASRVIDLVKNTRYYPVTETRVYSPGYHDRSVRVDDLNTAGTVTVDTSGVYTYATTWTQGTHFILTPANAALEGKPYSELVLLPQSGVCFSGYLNGLRVVGSFGWASCPSHIRQACKTLAGRYYSRRNSPLGVMQLGGVDGAAMRLARTDPDVAAILELIDGTPPVLIC